MGEPDNDLYLSALATRNLLGVPPQGENRVPTAAQIYLGIPPIWEGVQGGGSIGCIPVRGCPTIIIIYHPRETEIV